MTDGAGDAVEGRPADPVDVARRALMDALEQDERDRARGYARTMRLRAAMDQAWDPADGQAVMELAGTARIGQQRASTQLSDGVRLRDHYPHALELLDAGLLHQGLVEILLRGTAKATAAVQVAVGRRILDRLVGLDAADAYQLVQTTVVEVEADLELAEAERKHAQAKADRGVWVKPIEDGMVLIGATVDALAGHRFALDLEELVRLEGLADARAGRTRTKAQRRADVLAELPTRQLVLLQTLAGGKTEQLRAAAADAVAGAAETARGTTAAPPTAEQTQLPLNLPEPAPTRAWDLDPDELVIGLLSLPVRGPSVVNVHIGMSTALEIDHRSGYVEGLGPVPAQLVRLLIPDAGLRRVAVNPATGLPYGLDPTVHPPLEIARSARHGGPPPPPPPDDGPDHGPPGGPRDDPPPGPHDDPDHDPDPHYRAELERERLLMLLGPMTVRHKAEPRHDPSTGLRRHVEVRDLMCTGPGCRRTARACDLDHRDDYAEGGPTAEWNLDARSRRCHLAKHHGWTVTRDQHTGTTTWLSTTGRSYVRLPLWQPPPTLTDDLVLPLPRMPHALELPTLWTSTDAPLYPAPPPPPAPEPQQPPARTWHTGPAPF